jgi:hypothetical protein
LRHVAKVTICALALVALGACGEKDETVPAAPATTAPAGTGESADERIAEAESEAAAEEGDRGEVLEQGGVPEPEEDAAGPELSAAERTAVATARRYVAALDRRDGAAACELLAPGALADVKLPRERGGCGSSLTASIGFRDPRGLPVWDSAEIEAIASLEVEGESATVIPTVFTRFADRDEPSVEDDPIYLTRAGDGWAVAKPSLTLYRAIGQEPPPQALGPPPG